MLSFKMDNLFATGHLALWLLLAGLFFPRISLLIAAFLAGPYPANPLSPIVNVALWAFFPRFLIAYYISLDMGINNFWFWAYVVLGLAGLFGESSAVRHRVIRRTTVARNGQVISTTVEEEEV